MMEESLGPKPALYDLVMRAQQKEWNRKNALIIERQGKKKQNSIDTEKLKQALLDTLSEMDGNGTKADVLKLMEDKLKHDLSDVDLQQPRVESRDRRWEIRVALIVTDLRKKEVLNSEKGIWGYAK